MLSNCTVTCRRQAITLGWVMGMKCGDLYSGEDQATGNGSDASTVPPRWRGVFIRAFDRANRAARKWGIG